MELVYTCKYLVSGWCAVLDVKCLENRFMGIGGVKWGTCCIREGHQRTPMPKCKPARVVRSHHDEGSCVTPDKPWSRVSVAEIKEKKAHDLAVENGLIPVKEIHYCEYNDSGFCYAPKSLRKSTNDINGECHSPQECVVNCETHYPLPGLSRGEIVDN